MSRPRKPTLQQRAGGRDDEERQPDRDTQQREQPGDRAGGGRRCPALGEVDGEDNEWEQKEEQMQDNLAAQAEPAGARVSVGVTGEQHGLIEDKRRVPHRRRAAEQRQHHFGEHGLHDEQQGGADEEGEGVED